MAKKDNKTSKGSEQGRLAQGYDHGLSDYLGTAKGTREEVVALDQATKDLSISISKMAADALNLNTALKDERKSLAQAAAAQGAMNQQAKLALRDNKEIMTQTQRLMNVRDKMAAIAKKTGVSENALNIARQRYAIQIEKENKLAEIQKSKMEIITAMKDADEKQTLQLTKAIEQLNEANEEANLLYKEQLKNIEKATNIFKQWGKSIHGSVKAMLMLVRSMSPLQLGLYAIKAAFKGVVGAVKLLKKGFDLLMSALAPIFKILEFIGTLIMGGLLLAFNVMKDALKTVGVALVSVGKIGLHLFEQGFKLALETVTHLFEGLGKMAVEVLGQIIDIFVGQFPIIPEMLKSMLVLGETVFKNVFGVFKETFEGAYKTVKELFGSLFKVLSGPFEALQGMLKSLTEFVNNTLTSVFTAAANIIKASLDAALNTTQMLIMSAMKVMMWFWNTATQMYSGVSQWRQELEKLRGEYGALSKGISKFAIDVAKASRGAFRQFRYFRGEVLALAADLVKNLGPVTEAVMNQFAGEKSKVRLMLLNKALMLSAEAMQQIGRDSLASGVPMEQILNDIHDAAYVLGQRFKVSSKLIAKNIGEMKTDIVTWGALTTKQMAAAAMRVGSLGLEIKKIGGIMKAFDTFSDAAKAVSMLTRTFGIQIDALKMMKEEDPTKRLEIIRREFERTGQSTDKMSRRQIMLIAQQTQMDEQTVKAAFSTKNHGKSIKEISAELEKSGKKKKSDQQRVKELRDEIERLVKSGQQFTGVWDAMTKGLERGVTIWARQEGLTSAVTQGMWGLYKASRAAMEQFLTNSDIAKKFLKTTSAFFNVFTYRGKAIQKLLNDFFEDVANKGPNAFGKLWDAINKLFSDKKVLKKEGVDVVIGGIKINDVLNGLLSFFLNIFGQIAGAAITVLAEITTKIISGLNSLFVEGENIAKTGAPEWWNPIAMALNTAWPTLRGTLHLLWLNIKDEMEKGWKVVKAWWKEQWTGLFDNKMIYEAPEVKSQTSVGDDINSAVFEPMLTGQSVSPWKPGMFAGWTLSLVRWAKDEAGPAIWKWLFPKAEVGDWSTAFETSAVELKKFFKGVGEDIEKLFTKALGAINEEFGILFQDLSVKYDKWAREGLGLAPNVYNSTEERDIVEEKVRLENRRKELIVSGVKKEEALLQVRKEELLLLIQRRDKLKAMLSGGMFESAEAREIMKNLKITIPGLDEAILSLSKNINPEIYNNVDKTISRMVERMLHPGSIFTHDIHLEELLLKVHDSDRLKVTIPNLVVDEKGMKVDLSDGSAEKFGAAVSGMKAEFKGNLNANITLQIGDESLVAIFKKYGVTFNPEAAGV